jgi:PhzF family phenazine biosynthesis protein
MNYNYPVELIDTGLRTLIVPIDGVNNLIGINPDETELKNFCLANDIDIILVFTMDVVNKDNQARTRVFAPRFGYLEDPATGSGNSAFGCYMLNNGLWDGEAISIEQNDQVDDYNIVRLKMIDKKVLFGGSAITKIEGIYYL